jgi:hypothetical protein
MGKNTTEERCKKVKEMIDKIILMKSNRNYRFYDVIYKSGKMWEYSINNLLKDPIYKNTILYKYLEYEKNFKIKKQDINDSLIKKTLNDIVDEKIKAEKIKIPESNELVIQVRTGDFVITKAFLKTPFWQLIKAFDLNNDVYNIKKITFVTAYHYGDNVFCPNGKKCWDFQEKYHNKNIELLTDFFDSIIKQFPNYEYNLYSHDNIDLDFIYAIKAKYFIHDLGGYGALLKLCNLNYKEPLSRLFFTFAGGHQKYIESSEKIFNNIKNTNLFDKQTYFKEDFLKNDDNFWKKHEKFIKNNQRGYGLWLWKPYLIKKMFDRMNNGDIVFYLDSGCELGNIDHIKKCLSIIKTDLIIGTEVLHERKEKHWTKKDLFIKLNLLDDKYTETTQRQAGTNMFLINDTTRKLVNEWYELSCEYHNIDNSPSKNENFPGFKEHRHDQSIFSLLTKKYNIYSKTSLKPGIIINRIKPDRKEIVI